MAKVLKVVLSVLFVFIILSILFYKWPAREQDIEWGITFSKLQAQNLDLDWRKVYLAVLDELQVKRLRLIAYWSEIESRQGQFDFADLDWQVSQASQRNVEIVLAMGQKVPRWPECFIPQWVQEQHRHKALLNYLKQTINHYQGNSNIIYWQVENEPFLKFFGECPAFDKDVFSQEINLVHSLDSRPVLTTDSGEFGTWYQALSLGDVFGTTMYRFVYNQKLGYIDYHLSPNFFRLRKFLAELISDKKIINIELQAEPWTKDMLIKSSLQEQSITMTFDKFNDNISFARKTGISPAYLWGAEWWYWKKKVHNDNRYWQRARQLFK